MEKVITVLQVIVPIFTAVFLGVLAKQKQLLTVEQTKGLQQFVMNFGLPCVLFNSCFGANMGAESVTSMALALPLVLLSALWAFWARSRLFPYHNMPMLFAAQESGMLGIPLFMTLFGAEQAYRMGVLDMTQSLVAIPVIAILAASTGEKASIASIVKQVLRSPLLLMSLLGLALNLTGAADALNSIGIGGIITETTGFIAQPVSAVMLFTVGYNFSLSNGNRKPIFKLCAIHFVMFALFGAIILGIMSLMPDVEPMTRWAILLYAVLPGSFIAPTLARNENEAAVASGVCSILTVISLLIFCGMAIAVA